ncbi:MFS transporter [Actinokineospora iranica]|uniref:Sugar transporter n=1 Tax=Actinokineospora iranica TaxID=1271860 RepID=A0A1G6JW66_9PSEU|nr:MFS transporter [Actinokineospora iranica]SDC22957.1 Sugar transporter [Actinokineospora iranica]
MTHTVTAAQAPDVRPPVGRGWTARYVVASTGMWLAFLTPAQVQLARQAEVFAPAEKEALLGLALGVGAAVTAVAVPLLGAVSDRTRSRFGRRRPWVAGGTLVAAAGLLGLAGADGAASMLAGWVVTQLGLAAVQAGLVATIPDRVPRPQLGMVAGWAGMTQMLGALLGTVLVNRLVVGLAAGYVACAVVAAVSVLPFLGGRHEATDEAPPRATRARARWTADLGFAWASRFLVMLGFALITQYLLYYLGDEMRVADPRRAALVITAVTVLCAMASALAAGRWSDRAGRRRAFVAAGGLFMGIGALAMAVAPLWPVAIGAAAVVGVGFGAFLAVDLAVIASVLPSAEDTGRDLGVFAIAAAAPQILAPALAVPVLAVAGYPGLYVVTGLVAIAGGALVLRIRSVA